MSQSKLILRNQIKKIINELSAEQKKSFSKLACSHLFEFLTSRRLKNISISYSLKDEINTELFLKKYIGHFNCYLPKVNEAENTLELLPVSNLNVDLKSGILGIMEPITAPENDWSNKIECIIVPARALDIEGNRLGRGKGYYDRLLAKANRQKTIFVCMIFHCQLIAEVPFESFDIPIEYCITEKGVFHLRRKSN